MSPTRKIFFGFIAVFVIPALFFLFLEQGLKAIGSGKSFDYFVELEINGTSYFQDNPAFIQQFYSASLDITPLESTFPVEREENLVRVFVLGGSAARGFPNPAHGFNRHLETLLKEALPSKQVEVINTSMTAINSHVVYEIARSIPEGAADFAIVLMGNNEVIGPYGPGTFNQNFLSNLWLIRLLQAVKRSHIGQLLTELVATVNPRDHKEELRWKGMQMFTNESVPLSDPRLETVYRHYSRNLEDIVHILQRKGAHVLLSTVPVNLRHSAPFSSVNRPGLSDEERNQWEETVEQANASFDDKDWSKAVSAYEAALIIDPDYADSHFSLATSYEKIGDFQKASDHFVKARDLDALRFRADSRINQIIRDVSLKFGEEEFTLVDNEASFDEASQPNRPGWNYFLEHVHYNFSGDYLLAHEFSQSILKQLAVDGSVALTETEVARRIGYPSNMTLKVMERVVNMVKSPPFTGQSNQAELEHLIVTKRQQAEAQLGTVREQIERRQKVLRSGEGDWRIRYELAHLYDHLKDRPATYQQLTRLQTEYPHHHDSLVMLAKMLHQDGEYQRAIPYLELALIHARGDEATIAQLTGWLGLAYFKLGEGGTATGYLLDVPRKYPEQVHYALQAYATLIKYAMQAGNAESVSEYAEEAHRYAERVVRAGGDRDYPMLYVKMSQMMQAAGKESRAREWKERAPRRRSSQRPSG